MKRVVITGLGAITPLGNTVESFWENILNAKSGVGPITKFDTRLFKTKFAAEVKNFDPLQYLEKKEVRKYDLFTQYAIAASDQAVRDAGLDSTILTKALRMETGVIWASGNGGIGTFEEQVKQFYEGDGTPRFSPYFIPKMIADIAAGVISIRHQLYGPNYCTVSACASSNTAIINAADTIRMGKALIMIAGGSEAGITPASVGGFNASQALSRRNEDPVRASRPFAADRDGFVIGEGGGALILEELEHAKNRGAKIYAEIIGGGMAADAYHLTGTPADGFGARLGMERALKDGAVEPRQIDYINAHATSTPAGDGSEIKAIEAVFAGRSSHAVVSATKSMTGHLLGAAGAVEAIICTLAIRDNKIPATINTEAIDPAFESTVPIQTGKVLEKEVNYALNNTFGFGGHTASSLMARYRDR